MARKPRTLSPELVKKIADRAEGIEKPADTEFEFKAGGTITEPKERISEDATASLRMGRPSEYDPSFCDRMREIARGAATDMEAAQILKVSLGAIKLWKAQYPDFLAAMMSSKNAADDRVERSLWERAIGYDFESEEIYCYQGEFIRTTTIKHMAPDVNAARLWLINRRPVEWRDQTKANASEKLVEVLQNLPDEALQQIEISIATILAPALMASAPAPADKSKH